MTTASKTEIGTVQARRHVAAERLALFVVAPVTLWLAAQYPFPRWGRRFLTATAVGTLIVDGWFLWKWREARHSERK